MGRQACRPSVRGRVGSLITHPLSLTPCPDVRQAPLQLRHQGTLYGQLHGGTAGQVSNLGEGGEICVNIYPGDSTARHANQPSPFLFNVPSPLLLSASPITQARLYAGSLH